MAYVAASRTARCEHCGGRMPAKARSVASFCRSACRQAAYRKRSRAERERVTSEQMARVPAELTGRARWVRYSSKKVPLRIDGRFASVSDPATWSDFAAVARSSSGEGFGFVLTTSDRIVVIDLDHAVEEGRLLPWAQRIVEALPPTYMERGRSGTGVHLWFRGEVPAGRRIRRDGLAVEVYSDRRYMIVGDRVPGTPLGLSELPNVTDAVDSLI